VSKLAFINALHRMNPTSPNVPTAAQVPASARRPVLNPVNVKKLLLSKWTAVKPIDRRKHFLVAKIIAPEPPELTPQWIELEAVHSKLTRRMDWRELRAPALWRQGWV
jgi:tryptophan-rich hypothetical protein